MVFILVLFWGEGVSVRLCLCVTKNSTNSGSNNKQWLILLFLPKYFWKKVFAPPCPGAPRLSPSFGGTTLIVGFRLSSRLWPHGPKRAAVALDTPSASQEESGGSPPSSWKALAHFLSAHWLLVARRATSSYQGGWSPRYGSS